MNKGKPSTILTVEDGEIDVRDYWKLSIDGIEWVYVVRKLIDLYLKDIPIVEFPFVIAAGEGKPLYYLKRRYIPASAIVKATGKTLEQVEKMEVIDLRVSKKDLPNPTVDYWGEA